MSLFTVGNGNRKWFEVILWWEIRRIPFNIIVYFVGLGSFYIGYVTIPLIYELIGFLINVGYTFGWIVELAVIKKLGAEIQRKYPVRALVGGFIISCLFIFGIAIWIKVLRERPSSNISAVDATLPLTIGNVNFDNPGYLIEDEYVNSTIENTVRDYYLNDCLPDSLHTFADTYVNTVRVVDGTITLYVVLLKHYPYEEVASRVLFYDNRKKRFIGEPMVFRIYGLYDYDEGTRLRPSGLKTLLNISQPEIQRADYDHDGTNDYVFMRLFHNGTFNAIHEAVISAHGPQLDTLHFEERPADLRPLSNR